MGNEHESQRASGLREALQFAASQAVLEVEPLFETDHQTFLAVAAGGQMQVKVFDKLRREPWARTAATLEDAIAWAGDHPGHGMEIYVGQQELTVLADTLAPRGAEDMLTLALDWHPQYAALRGFAKQPQRRLWELLQTHWAGVCHPDALADDVGRLAAAVHRGSSCDIAEIGTERRTAEAETTLVLRDKAGASTQAKLPSRVTFTLPLLRALPTALTTVEARLLVDVDERAGLLFSFVILQQDALEQRARAGVVAAIRAGLPEVRVYCGEA